MAIWSAFLARPTRPLPEGRPSLTLFFLLTGTFLLTLVPHVIQFPIWVSGTIIAALICRSFLEAYRLPLPSTTFCGIMAIIYFGLIYVQFGTIRGREAGTAFTAGLLTIKFFELRRPRDIALIIFSCFFVVMSALLYSQVVELFIYCLITMWILVALLLRVLMGDTPQDRLLKLLRVSGVIFLQAAPLTLLLFFAFPRYQGTLGLPLDEATLGFTDTVAPGSIAKLAQNDAKAMYVEFTHGDVPLQDAMYWRGIVLWNYSNGAWVQGDLQPPQRARTEPAPTDAVTQEITLFPHNQRWLFSLDVPVSNAMNPAEAPTWAQPRLGDVLQLSYGRIDHLVRYDVASSQLRPVEQLQKYEERASTALPNLPNDKIDPKVQALADKLYSGVSREDYIYAVIRYLRHGGFTYTINPGEQGQGPEWLANFLFKSKTGFCEHFASAFAVLMRCEKIPARVVAGYFGADFNPYTNLYTVSQSHAHVWDEVWIPSQGVPPEQRLGRWVRFDPTQLIASAENGASSTNDNGKQGDAGEIHVIARPPSFFQKNFPKWATDALEQAQLRRDQIENQWDNAVLAYDSETQARLAMALGMGNKAPLGLLGICVAALAGCLFAFQKWIKHKPVVAPVEKLYASFCRLMARRGMPRATWEGPLAYTGRVAEVFPDDKRAIQRVGTIVAKARYGPVPADTEAIEKLRSLLNVLTASQAASGSRERRENSLPK